MSNPQEERPVHSPRGASGAHRWMNCAGSVQLIAQLVEKYGNVITKTAAPAAEGTVAHAVGAECLEEGVDAWEHGGEDREADGWKFKVDEGMIDAVQQYLDFVTAKVEHAGPNAILRVEFGMSSKLDPDAYGTADVTIYVPGDRIIIIDYKHGLGVVVEPTEEQLPYYGYLAYENRPDSMRGDGEPKVIELWIAQPRIPHPKGPFRQSVESPDRLTVWFEETVVPAMERTRDPEATLVLGEWCRFCDAKPYCPAMRYEAMGFPVHGVPEAMTGEEVGSLIAKGKVIAKFLSDLEEEAYRRLLSGEKVPGFKLVNKKSNRVWMNGAVPEINAKYGDEAYSDPKLLGPAGVDKLEGGKKFSKKWSHQPDLGLTMAPESDKREAASSLMVDSEPAGSEL